MINPKNRDMMARVYRIVEKYESAPKIEFSDDADAYFTSVMKDCVGIMNDYPGNDFATCLAMAVYNAVEKCFLAVNPSPLKDRTPEPEQQSFLNGRG